MDRLLLGLMAAIALAGAPAPASADPPALPEGFSTVQEASGLSDPTAIAYAPDGRLFVTEKAGRLRVVSPQSQPLSTLVLDISDHVADDRDRGLLGIAVDSSFASNGYVYLLYTYDADPSQPLAPKTSRLVRIHVLPDNSVEDPADPETVLLGSLGQAPCPAPANTVDCIPSDSGTHSIGTVRSAPDGTLWVGSGDGADYNGVDPRALRTYDEASMSGKILHVGGDGRGLPGHAFCPGETDLDLVCTKLYAKGFRNPFRFHLRPTGGLVAGDVGWETREELDLVQAGRSYGWPCYEGTLQTPGYRDLPACQAQYGLLHAPPALEYAHDQNMAVQSGPRYTATEYPAAYQGSWFYGDYVAGFIRLFDIDGQDEIVNTRGFATGYHGVDLELAPNGDLVYVDIGAGSVERVVYGNRAPVATATATPQAGDAPLTTTLSAEGSSDPDGDEVTFAWDFESDGTIDATGESVVHVYGGGAHTAMLRVSDTHGLSAVATVTVTADESAPTVTIEEPADGSLFRHGTPVMLRGAGADEQDGVLGDAALHWRIVLHHGTHTHVLTADATGHELVFTPPGDHDADSHYEIGLTARDSAGLEATRTVTIRPETARLTLDSSPPGATLSYSGRDYTSPAPLTAAIGYRTTISAESAFQRAGVTYRFDHWSDGDARLHDIVVPSGDTTLTAAYRADTAPVLQPLSTDGQLLGGSTAFRAATSVAAPRVTLRRPTRAGARSLGGRLTGSARRLKVEVALRTRGTRCRSWGRFRGGLGGVRKRCDRPAWMRAALTPAGPGSWRWRALLRGPLPPDSYVVSTRAVDARGGMMAGVRSTLVRLR